MSDEASRISKTQTQQADKTATFKPATPQIPTDGACPPGDRDCEARTPPPPPGSLPVGSLPVGSLEEFSNYAINYDCPWTTTAIAVVLIGVIFAFSSKRGGRV